MPGHPSAWYNACTVELNQRCKTACHGNVCCWKNGVQTVSSLLSARKLISGEPVGILGKFRKQIVNLASLDQFLRTPSRIKDLLVLPTSDGLLVLCSPRRVDLLPTHSSWLFPEPSPRDTVTGHSPPQHLDSGMRPPTGDPGECGPLSIQEAA